MQGTRRHPLSQAGIYLLARGVPGVIAFLTIPLFTRMLGPSEYGRYALVVASVQLLNALLLHWLRLSLTRYLPVYQNDTAKLKSTLVATTLSLVVAVGIIGAIVCLMPFARRWTGVIVWSWVLLAAQAGYELCCEYSRATIRPWHYMIMQLSRSILFIGLAAALIRYGAHWLGPVIALTLATAAAVIFAFVCDWRDVRLHIDREILKRMATYGVPVSLTVALTIVIFSCDRFLIAWLIDDRAAGLYSVASDFTSQTLTLLMLVISLATFPLAVRAWEHESQAAAGEHMRTNAALLLAVGVPCVVGLVVLPQGISDLLLGEAYRGPAASVIPLVAVATFLAGFKAFHFDAAFQFAHRTIYQVWIVLAAAVLNVVLNLFAIPVWGIKGAATMSGLAYLIAIGLTIYFGRKHFKLPFPWDSCGQVCAASAAMAAVLIPFAHHRTPVAVVAQIAGGAVVYGVVLIGLNFMNLQKQLTAAWLRRRSDDLMQSPSLSPASAVGTIVE